MNSFQQDSQLLRILIPSVISAFLFGFGPVAKGALLVYEGFNGYGSTGTTIGTPTPNANTVGLSKTTNYRNTGWKIANGLTFGALQTSGGAVAFDALNQTYLSTQLDLDNNSANLSSFTGTLYSSYLVNMGERVSGGGIQLRIGDEFGGTSGTRFFLMQIHVRQRLCPQMLP